MKDVPVPVFTTVDTAMLQAFFLWFVTYKIYDDYRRRCKCTGGNLLLAHAKDSKHFKAIGITLVSDLKVVF